MKTTLIHRLPLLSLLLAGVAGPRPETPAALPEPPRPAVTVTNLSAEQRETVGWALTLFDRAGLELPPVEFVRHPTTASCGDRHGMQVFDGTHSTIHLCTDSAEAWVDFLVLHELAHAWDHHSLTDERREAFLELRGLTVWRAEDLEQARASWGDLGAEHAAEIMVWGLMDRPIEPARIPDHDADSMVTGFELLTGRPPLYGFTEYC